LHLFFTKQEESPFKKFNPFFRMNALRKLLFVSFFLLLVSPVYAKISTKKLEKSPKNLVTQIYQMDGKAVVEIETDQNQGSGVIVSKNGIIVTNYHVIQGASSAVAKMLNGKVYPIAGIIEIDKMHDLALIKINASTPLPYIPLGDSSHVKIGEKVIAIGNPEGFQDTVSEGIVSGFRMSFGNIYWGFKLFQITTPISPGSSGGALLDDNGKLIGITSAGYVEEAQNLNVAVPIDYIKPMLPEHGKIFFVQKLSSKKVPAITGNIGTPFVEAYLYFMRQMLEACSSLIQAEETTLENPNIEPAVAFYKVRGQLRETASLFGLQGLPTQSPLETQIKFGLADVLIKLSEADEMYIQAFSSKENLFENLEKARETVLDARKILFQNVARVLSARLPEGGPTEVVTLLEQYPLYYKGDLYYGAVTLTTSQNKELVLVVYPNSPAAKAGLQEGMLLTSQLNPSFSSVYKTQTIFVEENGKPQEISLTPICFGYPNKPIRIGIEKFANESVSIGASQAVELKLYSSLKRIPDIDPVFIPEEEKSSVSEIASKYGLDYLLKGQITQFQAESVYSLSPPIFEGNQIVLSANFTVYDPFGQATSCCKPEEINLRSAFQSNRDAYETASTLLVKNLLQQMQASSFFVSSKGQGG
jgi:S1-C subfamily serine protease